MVKSNSNKKDRGDLNRSIEDGNIRTFLAKFNNRYHANFRIVDNPDPPDAIIQSGNNKRWIETTICYWNKDFAKDLNTYINPKEEHQSIDGQVYENPDHCFILSFVELLRKKLENNSYEKARNTYGRGYLAIAVEYPWFGSLKPLFKLRIKEVLRVSPINDRGYFRSIYLIYRSQHNGHIRELYRFKL